MTKTLLVLSGAVLLTAPSLFAQGRHYEGARGEVGRPVIDRARRGGGYGYGFGGRHNYGRYYYYGGVPYFFPFYGYGYGLGYYGGWYGDGFGGPYGGYGYDGGAGYPGSGAYEGRVVNPDDRNNTPPQGNGGALPEAVQRQLAKKGYYKGSIDGQFGPASRDALSRFQREHHMKETGRIDEPTLDALGFTDQR